MTESDIVKRIIDSKADEEGKWEDENKWAGARNLKLKN